MSTIHPTAIIADGAQIVEGCQIGPYCVIGEHVSLHQGVTLKSHVAIDGYTEVGEGSTIYPFASLGHPPQDLKFKGEKTTLTIGKKNTIREHVTMNPGTGDGGSKTIVGDGGLFMVGSHIAHDCKIGNHVILANNATLAGHVELGDHAIVGGLAAIHQFVRIGHHAMIGGMSGVEHDVIPYGSVMGERANLSGLNLIGLKRRGFSRDEIHALRNAYKALFHGDETLDARSQRVKSEFADSTQAMELIAFIESAGSRSLCVPKMDG
jgi:UDP-N-acetylglucosamine acyltransferase